MATPCNLLNSLFGKGPGAGRVRKQPRIAVLAGALLFFSGPGAPAGAQTLTLDDALHQAAAGSPRIAAARADAEAARMGATGASGSRWPSLMVGLEGARSDDPVFVFGSKLREEQFGVQDFGTFDPATGTFDLSSLNTPDPITNLRAAAMLRQVIWSGGMVTGRAQSADGQAEAAELAYQGTQKQIQFETEAAYRNAVLAEQRLDLIRESLAVAEAHARRVDEMHAEGLALESDRQALLAHADEIRAELALAEADSVSARSMLGMLLGAQDPVAETLADPGTNDGAVLDLPAALAAADGRDDVRAAEAMTRAAAGNKRAARSELFPTLDAFAGAEVNSDAKFDESGSQWIVGLGLHWRFDPGTPSRSGVGSRAVRAAEARVESARLQARHQVQSAHGRYLAAIQRERALEEAVASSRESFRLMEERHQEGLATTLELTESQNTLTRVSLQHAQARQGVALAARELELTAGTLAVPAMENQP